MAEIGGLEIRSLLANSRHDCTHVKVLSDDRHAVLILDSLPIENVRKIGRTDLTRQSLGMEAASALLSFLLLDEAARQAATSSLAKPSSTHSRQEDSQVRIAALILGILGGVFGLFGAGAALTIGGIGGAVGAEGASTVVGGGMVAILMSIIGIIGGALAMAKPKFAGWLMIIAAVVGVIAVFVAFIVPGVLLLVGGILALLAKKAPAADKTGEQSV